MRLREVGLQLGFRTDPILSRQLKPFLFFVKGHCDNSMDFFRFRLMGLPTSLLLERQIWTASVSPSIYLHSLAMEIYREDV